MTLKLFQGDQQRRTDNSAARLACQRKLHLAKIKATAAPHSRGLAEEVAALELRLSLLKTGGGRDH